MVPEPGLNPVPARNLPGPNQVFWPTIAVYPSPLPVVNRVYHDFFRTPRYRWWKPLLVMLLFGFSWLFASIFITAAAMAYDRVTGRVASDNLDLVITPVMFTANNLLLALAIPLAGLSAWAVFGQRPRWLSSVVGGFRWTLFWPMAGIAAIGGAANLGLTLLAGGVEELRWQADSLFLIAVILLTTPLQAAGEEYGLRGLLSRAIGSWFSARRAGFVVSTLITASLFTALHGAANPWLNIFYFTVAVGCSILVWRTGGLEAAVAFHVANNLFGEAVLPFTDLSRVFERGAGAAGPEALLPLTLVVATMAVMLKYARIRRPVTSSAPGSVSHQVGIGLS